MSETPTPRLGRAVRYLAPVAAAAVLTALPATASAVKPVDHAPAEGSAGAGQGQGQSEAPDHGQGNAGPDNGKEQGGGNAADDSGTDRDNGGGNDEAGGKGNPGTDNGQGNDADGDDHDHGAGNDKPSGGEESGDGEEPGGGDLGDEQPGGGEQSGDGEEPGGDDSGDEQSGGGEQPGDEQAGDGRSGEQSGGGVGEQSGGGELEGPKGDGGQSSTPVEEVVKAAPADSGNAVARAAADTTAAPIRTTIASRSTGPRVSKRLIRITFGRGLKVRSARVYLNGKAVKVRVRNGRATAVIDLRGRTKGAFVVRTLAFGRDGRVRRDTRVFRTCTPGGHAALRA